MTSSDSGNSITWGNSTPGSITGGGGGSTYTYGYDPYGNPLTITATGSYTTGASGITYPYSIGGNISFSPPLKADAVTLSRAQIKELTDEMTTRVKPGEKVVICVEPDVTDAKCEELREILRDLQIEGVVVRAATARTPPALLPFSAREQRVDYLARILDLWEQRPGLFLTELLSFYDGTQMSDNEFVTAVETHFRRGMP